MTQFDSKYKLTILALGLTSIQNKQKINYTDLEIYWKITSWLPLYLWEIMG